MMPSPEFACPDFSSPFWLIGGNAQTIWPALWSKRFEGAQPDWARQRWTTPDADFIDVDFSTHPVDVGAPTAVMFHGLEGSSSSHYAQAFASECRALGVRAVVPHFRGCSGELNAAPRAYHSGDWPEIDWILRRLAADNPRLVAAGVSLGGNALMRWAGEMGDRAMAVVGAVAAISSPLDLAASGQAIGRGFNRQVYTRMFLNTMKPKAMRKLMQHPGLFDSKRLLASRDLFEFDNVFTAPLHGFKDTPDYWARASAKPLLHEVRVPALCLNARNDPFVPAHSLPTAAQVSGHVRLWQPPHGGHVGFAQGRWPGQSHVLNLPRAVLTWLLKEV